MNRLRLRLFIARHGETVYNVAGRCQGDHAHTPLTGTGCAQAMAMGRALAAYLTAADIDAASLRLMASDSGRALQTLALIAEPLGLDWHAAGASPALREIDMGEWGGRYYHDIAAEMGGSIVDIIDPAERLFRCTAPSSESYADVAARLVPWIAALPNDGAMVVVSHGMTSRVLRGLLMGLPPHPRYDVPIAPGLPQGSMVELLDGSERLVTSGAGAGEAA